MGTIKNKKCQKTLTKKATENLNDAHDFEVKSLSNGEYDAFLEFADGWLGKVEKSQDVYERFIFLWMTFNFWMSLVVPDNNRNYIDKYLIHCVAGCCRFGGYFDGLYKSNNQFREWADEFASLGPIFRVIWLKNNKIEPWSSERESRREYVEKVKKQNPWVKKGKRRCHQFYPECAFNKHLDKDECVPADWPHIIHMIYQVRCNLFHGGKSHGSSEDRQFVKLSFDILWKVFQEEPFVKELVSRR